MRSFRVYEHRGIWLVGFVGLALLVAALFAGDARSAQADAGLIAFTRADGIYVMYADGTGVRPLRRGSVASRAFELDWSPDGRRLAFETFPGGAIWVMGADGKGLKRVVTPGGEWGLAHSPTWSPDGRRLAFSAERAEIWVVGADGSNAHRLLRLPKLSADTGLPTSVSEIDWSPDGRRIALTAHSSWVAWVYVVNTNGTGLRRLTANPKGFPWASDPDWSPDSRRIAFEQTSPSKVVSPQSSEIYVMTVDSGSQLRLTRNDVPDTSPTWSADGRIAFVRFESCPRCPLRPSREGDARAIFVMNADGTEVTRLTHNRTVEAHPAWQPLRTRR